LHTLSNLNIADKTALNTIWKTSFQGNSIPKLNRIFVVGTKSKLDEHRNQMKAFPSNMKLIEYKKDENPKDELALSSDALLNIQGGEMIILLENQMYNVSKLWDFDAVKNVMGRILLLAS
jgi:hypothetical protein